MLIIVEIFFLKALIHSARYLHFRMLNSILRSTVEFFESTPIGRILNRFSKDIEAIESAIPASYKLLVRCLSQALLIIIIISYSTPLFLIPTLPITIVFVFIQVNYKHTGVKFKFSNLIFMLIEILRVVDEAIATTKLGFKVTNIFPLW